ncbi:hypothetical protein [Flavobacterium sp.]|uniref:hypothetical protein n=1 Tax=Flavobacterium sp. TaxID=239 RepID=UPI002A832C97|nr:hypothetical protein [Flavobacterium sp.]
MNLKCLIFGILLITGITFGQDFSNSSKERITSSIINHFKLDRENIYLHLNKNTYLSNETLWFKGYIVDKKESKLNYQTTNVFVNVYDGNKKEIKTHLFYSSNGIIIGQIKLDENLESGTYYLHVYTNYMNNFPEDESSLKAFEYINTKDKVIDNNYSSNDLNINFSFEGGNLLYNSDNTVVTSIKDCNGKGLKISEISVKDSKNNIVNTFATNEFGLGKFQIQNTLNEKYKLEIKNKNSIIEKELPLPVIEGINIIANNFAFEDKFIIKACTNKNTLEKSKNKPYLILIQKNDFVNYINLDFGTETSKELVLNKNVLFKGINTIRLIDDELNLISERIIYNPIQNNTKFTISNQIKKGDSIRIKGATKDRISNFSISILPKNNISTSNSIHDELVFNNYLKNKISNSDYFLNQSTRKKQYELDLFLINNSPKTEWKEIIKNTITEKYTFDIGLDIEGKINQVINNPSKMKLRLFSINGVNELADIDEDNSFIFKNILAIDSSNFHFSLLKDESKLQSLNVYSIIKNNNRKFLKPLNIKKQICNDKSYILSNGNNSFEFPFLENQIQLNNVTIITAKKEKMNFLGQYNNSMARAYKISDEDFGSFRDVLSFIASHGYDVSTQGGTVTINSRVTRSILGSRSPAVFLDNAPITDFYLLANLNLNEVDEIYFNKNGYGMGMDGMNGSIRIYRKIQFTESVSSVKVKSKSLVIKNGFEKLISYANPKYIDYQSSSFSQYGTLHWEPSIYTNEIGEFEFSFPHFNQKEIILNIQGIDNQGDFYSENIILNN